MHHDNPATSPDPSIRPRLPRFVSLLALALLFALGATATATAAQTDPQLELLIDLEPGPESGVYLGGVPFVGAGRFFFTGCQAATGCEPWVTDGTALGTQLLADLRPGSEGSFPEYLTVTDAGIVLFSADDGSTGRELYRSDGTPGGTYFVADLKPGIGSSGLKAKNFAVLGDLAIFLATLQSTNAILVYDTGAGGSPQTLVDESFERVLGRLGGSSSVVVSFSDDVGREIYSTGGAFTSLVADLVPGTGSGVSLGLERHAASGNRVFFVGTGGGEQHEIFSTDGATITDHGAVRPGAGDGDLDELTPFAGGVIFTADNDTSSRQLWFAPPSGDVVLLVDGVIQEMSPTRFRPGESLFYFRKQTNATGAEIWRTDGTPGGTFAIDLVAGSGGSNAYPLVVHGDVAFFEARGTSPGSVELWRTDGTLAGTETVAVDMTGENFDGGRGAVLGDRLILSVDADATGLELWSMTLGVVFADGFESGGLGAWDGVVGGVGP